MVIWLLACSAPPAPDAEPGTPPSATLGDEAVVFVGEAAAFDAGESVGDTFAWDFGDGGSAEGAAVTHAYTSPGRYTVRLTAASGDGRTDIASTSRVAVFAPLATPPTASGRLALYDGVLYAALPDTDEVVVVTGNEVVDRLPTCGHPVAVSAAGGRLAVACRDDAVQIWDTATRSLVSEEALRWGARPMGVAVDGDGAVVALSGTGELVRVGGEVLATVADAHAVAVSEGVAFAPRFRSPDTGGVVTRVENGGTEFALLPDPGPDSDTDARGVPTLLGAVAVSPDGRSLVVAGSKANVERGLYRDGLALTHETTSRAALRLLDAETGEAIDRALFDNRDLVGAVAYTPLGDRLLVAHLGAGVVDVLDPFTLERIGGFQAVGVGLDGLATDGETAWVLASVDLELVAYDLHDGNAEVEVARVALGGEPSLGARVFTFAGDPRMSTDAYISCASCHPDGTQDARTWDFADRGEGLRNTQPLYARPDAGPFHWSANFDEIQDFENPIRDYQAGDGFLADEDLTDPLGDPKAGLSPELDALADYVRAFTAPRSPFREADGSWTAAAQRGREVFLSEGCDTCHSGTEMTDAAWNEDGTPLRHDVGTLVETSGPLTGLRTPSLRGLWASAPYLHDGRAATIEEALLAHGLEADPDLVAYLQEVEDGPE